MKQYFQREERKNKYIKKKKGLKRKLNEELNRIKKGGKGHDWGGKNMGENIHLEKLSVFNLCLDKDPAAVLHPPGGGREWHFPRLDPRDPRCVLPQGAGVALRSCEEHLPRAQAERCTPPGTGTPWGTHRF